MATVNQTFPFAPMGRRVIATLVVVAAVLAGTGVNLAIIAMRLPPQATPAARLTMCLAPLIVLLVGIPIFFYQRAQASQFRIDEDVLVLGTKRHPLAGMTEIARDPEILKCAVKVWGNGGLGAIRGRYWSRRVGKFEAFMTDPDHAVVLRWPEKVLAVSPADPEFFILMARKAAGLR